MMIVDLNSSALWDYKKNRICNHTDVFNALAEFGMTSAYHAYYTLPRGKEEHSTYYMQRKTDRPTISITAL